MGNYYKYIHIIFPIITRNYITAQNRRGDNKNCATLDCSYGFISCTPVIPYEESFEILMYHYGLLHFFLMIRKRTYEELDIL